jgi:hypothetical protein
LRSIQPDIVNGQIESTSTALRAAGTFGTVITGLLQYKRWNPISRRLGRMTAIAATGSARAATRAVHAANYLRVGAQGARPTGNAHAFSGYGIP